MSKNEKEDTIFGCFTVMKKTHRNNQYPFTSPKWFETLSKLQERENPLKNYTSVTNSMISKSTKPQGSHQALGENWPFLSGQVLMDVPLQAGISCWTWGTTLTLCGKNFNVKSSVKGQPRKHSPGETLCIFLYNWLWKTLSFHAIWALDEGSCDRFVLELGLNKHLFYLTGLFPFIRWCESNRTQVSFLFQLSRNPETM